MRKYMNDSFADNDYYWDRFYSKTMGQYYTQIEQSFIRDCLTTHLTKPTVIFDIGGGSGRIAISLYRDGHRVLVGETDPLPLKILHHRESAIPSILVSGEATRYPIRASSLDCVLCLGLPSLIESDWFFSECSRILKCKGIAIFTTDNKYSYRGFYKKFLFKEDVRTYPWKKLHYASSFRQVRLRLRNAGFKLVRARGFNWLPAPCTSNSQLVPYLALIERLLHLNALVSLSPWTIIEARKIKEYAS